MVIKAPWQKELVSTLNKYQKNGLFHPYTCGKCKSNLVATEKGWICPEEGCGYIQDWAHHITQELMEEAKDIKHHYEH